MKKISKVCWIIALIILVIILGVLSYGYYKKSTLKINNPIAIMEIEKYGTHIDYAAKEYTNWIYVNYWQFRPGETVEILENGRPLAVERTADEDPLFSVSFAPVWAGVEGAKIFTSHKSRLSNHMFRARAKTAKGKILVRVRNASGEVVREEMLTRPGTFSRDMQ